MKDIRQGNDIKVAWSIFRQDGEPYGLEGLDVSLYLKSMFGRKELSDFTISENMVFWTFFGKDQKNSGKYSLELVINEGEDGMITTDACDFVNLVPCSCKIVNSTDDANVTIETIELSSELGLASFFVDDKLSDTSENPVQNKAITDEINKINSNLADKQDIISDLETIRSGAAKGATALQEVPEELLDEVSELSDNLSDLSSEVNGISNGLVNNNESIEQLKKTDTEIKSQLIALSNSLEPLAQRVSYLENIISQITEEVK